MVTPGDGKTFMDRDIAVFTAILFGIVLMILTAIFLIGFQFGKRSGKNSLQDPTWRNGLHAKIISIITKEPSGKCTIFFEEIGTHWENNYEMKDYGYVTLPRNQCTDYKINQEIFSDVKTYYKIYPNLP